CTRQTTGYSGRPKIDVCDRRGRYRLAVGDISELQMAAGFEHTANFAKYMLLVGAKIDHPVGDDHVGPAVSDGQIFKDTLAELNVAKAHRLSGRPRLGQHLFGHIDANDMPGRTNLAGGEKAIESAT